ncbi:hypothetical protein L6452_08497 [Arctium lappa]|uniref:Uncharacterized protein n=1 Tax=Arctium lappa TaxID=4217 RepID=A0ACB9DHX6_ARCLA|nr:hypothetical protein L6452_08497 [Arctium lappa]
MSQVTVDSNEIDIVIAAFRSDLTSFMEEWRPIFSRFHLIIVQDPDLKEELKIPKDFNFDVYTKSDIDKLVGSFNAAMFSGYSCRYFGYLVSKRKYIVSIDDDCSPAKDNNGDLVDIVTQHITNLKTPATPFFFNTLYDPYRKGADFVRGYPFGLRNGVACVLSCGLWLNLADYDAPTQSLKPELRNSRYVDAVLTVPKSTMMPMSGINIAFDREMVGPALLPALKLAKEGKFRGSAIDSLKKEWEGVKLMEELVPFFQSLKLSSDAVTAEGCVTEIAATVKKGLGQSHPELANVVDNMVAWLKIGKEVRSSVSG